MNVRAAYIHIIGDLIQSIGVIIAASVIYFYPQYSWIDPICTFLFSIIVLVTTIGIVRDCIRIIMEAAPEGFDIVGFEEELKLIGGV